MVENILDKAKEAAKDAVANVTEKVISFKENFIGDEQAEIEEEFKDANSSKVKDVIDSINESMELITSSGYEFKGIGVALGLSPSITLSFHYLRTISDEAREELLEKAKDKRMVKLIVKLLFKAGDFYKSVKLGDYELDAVIISLGLAPGLNISFKKNQ